MSIISSGSSMGAQKPRKLSIPAQIAIKHHAGRFAAECSEANFDQLDLSEGPLFVAAMASCKTQAKHDCLAKNKLSTPLGEHKITAAQKSAAVEPVPVVHTAIFRDM